MLQSRLLITLGWMGICGCAALIAGAVVAAFLVPNHDWISDTISDLAAGRSEIAMDIALYGFSVGLFATALGAAHLHPGGGAWSTGIFCLAILAGIVIIVGARNEYGDSDSDGVVIHSYLVYALGLLFLAMPLCMAWALPHHHSRVRRVLIGLGLLWGCTAPVFFFLPTGIDGLYERALGVIAAAMIVTLCTVFIGAGRLIRAERQA
ncbi:DUF998 domain-containing protein [Roseovarius spongiae]|uniref:DUF998 domain-containing protein n=2 Tax=Roseovarius spongiae TaxID=2320272 RepID=A0A3A8BAK4_9RHOB|nr:DUF998 domain-containing protein [Roseovarius spongiae]